MASTCRVVAVGINGRHVVMRDHLSHQNARWLRDALLVGDEMKSVVIEVDVPSQMEQAGETLGLMSRSASGQSQLSLMVD